MTAHVSTEIVGHCLAGKYRNYFKKYKTATVNMEMQRYYKLKKKLLEKSKQHLAFLLLFCNSAEVVARKTTEN